MLYQHQRGCHLSPPHFVPHDVEQDLETTGFPTLFESIWAHQFGERSLFPAQKLLVCNATPCQRQSSETVNPSEAERGFSAGFRTQQAPPTPERRVAVRIKALRNLWVVGL